MVHGAGGAVGSAFTSGETYRIRLYLVGVADANCDLGVPEAVNKNAVARSTIFPLLVRQSMYKNHIVSSIRASRTWKAFKLPRQYHGDNC